MKLLCWLLLLITCFIQAKANEEVEGPIVTIRSGQLRGIETESRGVKIYYQFLGIPFGKIPARFDVSLPADPWNGIRNATNPGPICNQPDDTGVKVGIEDCLFVNVHTPFLPSNSTFNNLTQLLPVLVWVHGGGWVVGAGSLYGGKYFMDEDIVLVTMNYRLGALGFFNLGVKEAAGNQGPKDVVLALKWIRDNIAAFGGDPNQITIQGESCGAIIVSNLIISPMSQGLFNKAIIQSGVGTTVFALNPRPKYYSKLLATNLNCTRNNATETAICLRNLDVREIMNGLPASVYMLNWWNEVEEAEFQFNFCVEDYIEGVEPFFLEAPRNLIEKGNFTKIPLLIGVVQIETYDWARAIFANQTKLDELGTDWNRVVPMPFYYYDYGQKSDHGGEYDMTNPGIRDELSQRIRQLYLPGNTKSIINNTESFFGIENGISDSAFLFKTRQFAKLMADNGAETYLYMFDRKMTESGLGPIHAEELWYLFNYTAPSPDIEINSTHYEFSKKLVKLWVSFVKNGKPIEIWGNSIDEWKPFNSTEDQVSWFHIYDDRIIGQVEDESFRRRMEFWEEVDRNYYTKSANSHANSNIRLELRSKIALVLFSICYLFYCCSN